MAVQCPIVMVLRITQVLFAALAQCLLHPQMSGDLVLPPFNCKIFQDYFLGRKNSSLAQQSTRRRKQWRHTRNCVQGEAEWLKSIRQCFHQAGLATIHLSLTGVFSLLAQLWVSSCYRGKIKVFQEVDFCEENLKLLLLASMFSMKEILLNVGNLLKL